MIAYFVTYDYHGCVGNMDISRDRPIADRNDINSITAVIANELNYDIDDLVILKWRRYDSEDE